MGRSKKIFRLLIFLAVVSAMQTLSHITNGVSLTYLSFAIYYHSVYAVTPSTTTTITWPNQLESVVIWWNLSLFNVGNRFSAFLLLSFFFFFFFSFVPILCRYVNCIHTHKRIHLLAFVHHHRIYIATHHPQKRKRNKNNQRTALSSFHCETYYPHLKYLQFFIQKENQCGTRYVLTSYINARN